MDIPTLVHVKGFSASIAKLWQVNAPALNAMDDVREVVKGADLKVDGNQLNYVFPAHSMTAIEISKQ